MLVEVIELDGTSNSTGSKFLIDKNPICLVLEDGYRNPKVKHHTRIPAGRYNSKRRYYGGFYERYKARFGHEFVWQIMDVPGFSDVLIHIGNFISDTSGCLLLGEALKLVGSDYRLISSTPAYKRFYELTKNETEIDLIICRG